MEEELKINFYKKIKSNDVPNVFLENISRDLRKVSHYLVILYHKKINCQYIKVKNKNEKTNNKTTA